MTPQVAYADLQIAEIAAAARLAVVVGVLRGLQALGPKTPIRRAIYITFDPQNPDVVYPQGVEGAAATSTTVVLENQYSDLRVDAEGLEVTLSFRGRAHRIEIPFAAISRISDEVAGFRADVPPRIWRSASFRAAFQHALATLMVFQWGSDATYAELEGRATFALLPALLVRLRKGAVRGQPEAVLIFEAKARDVSLPEGLAALDQPLMSFSLGAGDRDVTLGVDEIVIACEGARGEGRIVVPFSALREIAVPALSLQLPIFPGPVADRPSPRDASVVEPPGQGFDLKSLGRVTSPSRFPPGSIVESIWREGRYCLSGYVGRHSIPGLRFPEDLRQRVPLGPSSSLEILVFDELWHKAVAFKRGSNYWVGLYHGLVLSIPEFATALWTRPDVAPWIGDVSRLPPADEPGEIPAGLETLDIARRVQKDFGSLDQQQVLAAQRARSGQRARLTAALDPVRRMALQQCIEDAFRCIWLHEIGHVVWGHVDLIADGTGVLGISEIDDACGEALAPELGQFLEAQADQFAFENVLNFHLGRLEMASKSGALGNPGRGAPDVIDEMTIATMGCVIIQLLLAANLRLLGRQDVAKTHPPIWFRVLQLISQARAKHAAFDLGDRGKAEAEIEALLDDRLNRAISSIVATHPMLMEVFSATHGPAESDSRAYVQAFEEAASRWEAIVRPYFKFYRGADGKAALRD